MSSVKEVLSNLVNFDSYSEFLTYWVKSQPSGGRGLRLKLAKYLDVQTSYISRVINGSSPLRDIHIGPLTDFIGFNEKQKKHFHFLVLHGKAENEELKSFYRQCLFDSKKDLMKPTANEANEIDQEEARKINKYYSNYLYSLLHMATTIGPVEAKELSKKLLVPEKSIESHLKELANFGLIEKFGNSYKHKKTSLYISLPVDQTFQHHRNWRVHNLQKLQLPIEDDFRFTSILTCSEKDFESIKEQFRLFLKEIMGQIAKSPAEKAYSLTMDFLEII